MNNLNLSHIQGLADELAKEDFPSPDFSISHGCDTAVQDLMEIQDSAQSGKGFYARKDVKAGSVLLTAKPLCLVMDWSIVEDDDEDDEDDEDEMSLELDDGEVMKGSKRNGMLVIEAAKAMKEKPSLWFDHISQLFPRELTDDLPLWMCEDEATGMQIEDAINNLKDVPDFGEDDDDESDDDFILVEEIRQRLPLIVRYNCLSVETGAELFIHPNQAGGGHITLSGTGLYHRPSFFNHSHKPNVSRYSIGDVMFFVANQDVKKGAELCISYIESEVLCESDELRSKLLDMDFDDFVCDGDRSKDKNQEKPSSSPIVDVDMQDQLMTMHPLQRLDEINALLEEAAKGNTTIASGGEGTNDGRSDGNDNNEDEVELELHWFKCDVHQLRILLALTYDSLGQTSKALEEWEACVTFTEEYFPPVDESGIALRVQAALCAFAAKKLPKAKDHADEALRCHNLLFGGGVQFFRQRYRNEFKLKLRSPAVSGKVLDVLWPM